MKIRVLFLLLVLSTVRATAQVSDSIYLVNNYTKTETMIPMRDGIKLFTTIYAPKDKSEKHPVLMMRTPYSVAPYGDQFSARLYKTHWRNYITRNYIIVLQDVRGKFMSEGEFVDVRPFNPNKKGKQVDEASDTYDAIDWLIKHVEGNNGRIGVFGISYPGFYATMAALSNHPALKAVSPQAPVTDWFMGDDFHHNGAFALTDGFRFYSGFGRPRPVPTKEFKKGYEPPIKDLYDFHLQTGAIKNHSKLLGDSLVFWNDLMQHPNLDDWWRARDARRACTNIKPAILVVGGTFDAEDCYGAWNLYKAIEKQNPNTENKLVMGPWFHGGWGRGAGRNLGRSRFGDNTSEYYQQQIELPFFEKHLREKKQERELPEASIFFTGENAWRTFDSWPTGKAGYSAIYLGPNGKLSFSKPMAEGGFSSYSSSPKKPVPFTAQKPLTRNNEYMIEDQRFLSGRPDVISFSTDWLDKDMCLGGPIEVSLNVSTTGTDADFVVKLIDVYPDDFTCDSTLCYVAENTSKPAGYQMLVRAEIMRGRFRNSFEKPEPFTPGQVEKVKFTLPDVAHTFRKDHKLMVQIQSSWYPLFDMNPQTFTDIYHCEDKDFQDATIQVYHNTSLPSSLTLPIIQAP